MKAPLRATPVTERIEALDVMRGFALLGIFIMNMPGFSSSFFTTNAAHEERSALDPWWDIATQHVNLALLEGKFNGLFTLLFGMGLALQLQRLGDAAASVVGRRLLVLWCIGGLHMALLWGGDVLHIYAVIGIVLWALRNCRATTVLLLALALLLAQFVHGMVEAGLWSAASAQAEQSLLEGLMNRDNLVLGHGSWLEGIPVRLQGWWLSYSSPHLLGGLSWFWLSLLCTAMLGLWAVPAGWLLPASPARTALRSQQGLWTACAVCAAGLLLRCVSDLLIGEHDSQTEPVPELLLGWALGDTARVLQVMGYAALILRWCDGTWAATLRHHLATVGRMPLSQYLLQSLMGTFIFNGWGLGLWGSLGTLAQTGLAIGLFILVQVPLAHAWFARHSTGPVEALWRRLSYGKTKGYRAEPKP